MCTIALAKVQRNYNCYNVYFYECLPKNENGLSGKPDRPCRFKNATFQISGTSFQGLENVPEISGTVYGVVVS